MVTLGLPMEPFTQTSSNLEAAATNLAELIRHHNLVAYADPEIRLALSRTVAVETPRGVRISRSKASHRIDVVAALSFACFGAAREGQYHFGVDHDFQQQAARTFAAQTAQRANRGFDHVSNDGDRLYSRGEDFSAREDRAQALAKYDRRRKWAGF